MKGINSLIIHIAAAKTERAQKIRIKCIESKDHERITTRRPKVSGVQSGVTKSKSLYTRYMCDGAYLRVVFSFNSRSFKKCIRSCLSMTNFPPFPNYGIHTKMMIMLTS